MSSTGGTTTATSASWRSGTHVGRYRVHKLLARGGMGEIYLAEFDAAPGKRDYRVLKRLIGATQGIPEQAQMFLDEGRLASMLRHPNIVTVHDVGTEAGTYYIAMEYLHGVDARAVLKEVLMQGGKLPIDQAVRLGICACAAMHHAHELTASDGKPMQIVHRDISPQNLFLTFEGEVKLLDFGVARTNRRDRETTTRGLKGKVPYMSPEQCLSRPIDRRSDIFSLGIILFELTVGTRLFRGNSDYELMQQIVTGEVVPPSALDPHYPAALERIVLKALTKPVDKRYQSALEMERELESFGLSSGLDLGATAMARFLHETFGEPPEAWKVPDDAADRSMRSGPVLIERSGARQTVQMPVATRATPPPMRTVPSTPPTGSEMMPVRTIVGVAPAAPASATAGAREPSGKTAREPSGPIDTESEREPTSRWRREPSGKTKGEPSGKTKGEPSGKTRGEPSGASAAGSDTGASDGGAAGAPPGSATPATTARPAGSAGNGSVSATGRSGPPANPIITAGPSTEPQADDEARRRRIRAIAAAAVLGGVLLVGVGLRFALSDSNPTPPAESTEHAGAGAPASPQTPPATPVRRPRVTESSDETTTNAGYGNVVITASQHRATFLLDGKKVSSVAPFQLDHLDAARPHTLEVSLGPGKPTVLQRFQVLPNQTVVLNVRFDAGGGGKVVGSEAATANGPTGAIRVETTPPCNVFFDGKRVGTSPFKQRIAVGAHKVSLEPPGGGALRSVEVRVNEGKVTVVTDSF